MKYAGPEVKQIDMRYCRRFPQPMCKKPTDWCGEFERVKSERQLPEKVLTEKDAILCPKCGLATFGLTECPDCHLPLTAKG